MAEPRFGAVARPLSSTLRRASEHPVGRAVSVGAYGIAARLAGGWLLKSPSARGVYATGSLTRPALLAPGDSDIDLVVWAAADTRDEERALRRELERRHRAMNALGRLFYNLDYVLEVDLPHVLAFPSRWASQLARRGRLLAGHPFAPLPVNVPAGELRLEAASGAFRRWRNTGARLLDPDVTDPPAARLRAARRMLRDVSTAWLGLEPDASAREILDALPSCAPSLGALLEAEIEGSPRHSPGSIPTMLAATLEALEAFACELTASWTTEWPVRVSGVSRAPLDGLDELFAAARPEGFDALYFHACRPGSDERLPLLVSTERSARETIDAAVRLFGRAPDPFRRIRRHALRPVVVTPPLFRAAALFPPAPFPGASLAASPLFHAGLRLAPPCSPPPDVLRALLRVRAVERLVLLRSLRFEATPHLPRRLAEEIAFMLPALERALSGAPLELDGSGDLRQRHADLGDPDTLEAVRTWGGRIRDVLESERLARSSS